MRYMKSETPDEPEDISKSTFNEWCLKYTAVAAASWIFQCPCTPFLSCCSQVSRSKLKDIPSEKY
jgi:hypothetical protein